MAKNQQQKQKKLQLKAAKRKKRELEIKKKEFLKKQQNQLDERIAFAIHLIQEKNYHEAEKLLNQILSTHPDVGYVYYAYGLLYVTSGHPKQGIIALEKSIVHDPKFAPSYLNLAIAYFKGALLHKMVETIDKMHELTCYDTECYTQAEKLINDARVMLKKGENTSLEQYCQNLHDFDEAFNLMSAKSYPEAIDLFSSLIKKEPGHVACHGNIGICYSQMGQKALAIQYFDKALALDPNYELALVNKIITEELKEGEKLNSEMKRVEYYKDFPIKNKSLLEEMSMKTLKGE
ncbi:tetratricopeptide repeat protein [sulfur-oxidizing endosymbiont of Gigantopelta aegis]|uniref:tetratricopeptide repeat protein n=1 Tax=sulfur-oxidizing endosymbiont of Gigantopelta aegis TaxID=2794934 RepID=UPI0018DEBFBD|nr:tetratricopeptide repeat protein [sulfur-oxidizing endosymbiont of Gigantopelta aegis]